MQNRLSYLSLIYWGQYALEAVTGLNQAGFVMAQLISPPVNVCLYLITLYQRSMQRFPRGHCWAECLHACYVIAEVAGSLHVHAAYEYSWRFSLQREKSISFTGAVRVMRVGPDVHGGEGFNVARILQYASVGFVINGDTQHAPLWFVPLWDVAAAQQQHLLVKTKEVQAGP